MRIHPDVWLLLLVALISGCLPLGGQPTPLPWLPTPTQAETTDPQAGTTPTASAVTATASAVTATVQATSTPSVSPPTAAPELPSTEPPFTWHPSEQAILVEVPGQGQRVGNPLIIRGRTQTFPFEGTLVVRVYDALGQRVAEHPIIAQGDPDGPATFEARVTYGGMPGAGRVEVLTFSSEDGSVVAEATVPVTLEGFPGGGTIESPAPKAVVTLPIKLLARVGQPDQEVNVTVTWEDGARFTQTLTTLVGLDDQGLLIVAVDRVESDEVHPPTQAGAVEIQTLDGNPLAWQPVQILHPMDPGTLGTQVYWIIDERITPQQIRIPQTLGIGRASLEMLLWGPVPQNREGFTTAIPTPRGVLTYPGRDPNWGERVRLRNLTIVEGVAYADFSVELGAHTGGSMAVILIRQQIASTLLQFATVDHVVISINGQTGVLEP